MYRFHSAQNIRPDMMSDEDSCSRDSGIFEMDTIESMPTSFGFCDENQENKVPLKTISQSMQTMDLDVDIDMNMPLFDESPKSRTMFARPVLSVRNNLSSNSSIHLTRKRTFGGFVEPSKRVRVDEQEIVPSCSRPGPAAFKLSQRRSGSMPFQRAHSTSGLERGAQYAKHHQNDGELPKLVEVEYHLPVMSPATSTAFRNITAETMCELLSTLSEEEFLSRYILIDCRYPYEYQGGHIKYAVNMFDPSECESFFFNPDGSKKETRAPIFYCEYSQKRGPSMANTLRSVDRKHNEPIWPHCDYMEMYVLHKGFKNFFASTRDQRISPFCTPDGYTAMDDFRYTSELRKWNFHKKSVLGTSVRVVEPSRSRMMLRQMSADEYSSVAFNNQRPSSRRPLFNVTKSPSAFSLSSVPESRTPSPLLDTPLVQPQFS